MKKVVAVSLNPALDTSLFLKGLDPQADFNPVEREICHAGGKAANFTRALNRWGIAVAIHVLAGRENVEKYDNLLRKNGVEAEYTVHSGCVRENMTLFAGDKQYKIDRSGRVEEPGWQVSIEKWLAGKAEAGAMAVFSGSLPQGISSRDFVWLVKSTRDMGYEILLDTAALGRDELEELSPRVIKPNLREFSALAGVSRLIPGKIDSYLDQVHRRGMKEILLSMGEEGLIYSSPDGRWTVAASPVPVRNTVGAGDAALAGYTAAVCGGLDGPEIARLACAFGTAKVQKEGTSMPSREEVLKALNLVSLRKKK